MSSSNVFIFETAPRLFEVLSNQDAGEIEGPSPCREKGIKSCVMIDPDFNVINQQHLKVFCTSVEKKFDQGNDTLFYEVNAHMSIELLPSFFQFIFPFNSSVISGRKFDNPCFDQE